MPRFNLDDAPLPHNSDLDLGMRRAVGLCIRVNKRGVAVTPVHWTALDMTSRGWTTKECNASSVGLCGICFLDYVTKQMPTYDPFAVLGAGAPAYMLSEPRRKCNEWKWKI